VYEEKTEGPLRPRDSQVRRGIKSSIPKVLVCFSVVWSFGEVNEGGKQMTRENGTIERKGFLLVWGGVSQEKERR